MTLRRSLIIVNYRSWQETREAVVSARAASSEPLDVVVVDNSCSEEEAEALGAIADVRLVVSATNSGYAGGLNQGVALAEGEILFLSNPDMRFGADSLDILANEVTDRTIAGPRFTWDAAGKWQMPPADEMGVIQKLDEVASQWSSIWNRARDVRRLRDRVNFWRLEESRPVRMLSGALLALRRTTFDRIGGFDAGYALYFEEIDFIRRAKLRGIRTTYVPRARCRHLYNQSAAREPSSSMKFTASEVRFRERWDDSIMLRFGNQRKVRRNLPLHPLDEPIGAPPIGLVELSPLSDFSSASGSFASGSCWLPRDVLASWGGGELYCRVIDLQDWTVKGSWRLDR